MRASLVVLDADRRRHRHALHHLQHHPEAYFPYLPAGSLVFFKNCMAISPYFAKKKKELFRNEQLPGPRRLDWPIVSFSNLD